MTLPKELVDLIKKDIESAISNIKEINLAKLSDNADDTNTFIVYIHGLKSALNNLGEEMLSTVALNLEIDALNKNFENIPQRTEELFLKINSLF